MSLVGEFHVSVCDGDQRFGSWWQDADVQWSRGTLPCEYPRCRRKAPTVRVSRNYGEGDWRPVFRLVLCKSHARRAVGYLIPLIRKRAVGMGW